MLCEKEISSSNDLNALIKLCCYDTPLHNGFGFASEGLREDLSSAIIS